MGRWWRVLDRGEGETNAEKREEREEKSGGKKTKNPGSPQKRKDIGLARNLQISNIDGLPHPEASNWVMHEVNSLTTKGELQFQATALLILQEVVEACGKPL